MGPAVCSDLGLEVLGCLALLGGAALACGCASAPPGPWVRKLAIEGGPHVDRKDLISKLAVEESTWVPIAGRRYLDPFALQLDRKRIEAYYHAHGYYAARVLSTEVKPRGPKSVDVRFVVEEGPATKIDAIEIAGLDPVDPNGPTAKERTRVLAGFPLERGQVFDDEKLTAATEQIQGRLKDLGRPWAMVQGSAEVDRERHLARLRIAASPGPSAHIGRITTRGDFSGIRPRLLIAHAGLDPGDLVTPELLEGAQGRLYNLGIFSSVKVDYAHMEGPPGATEVILTMNEGPLRELRLGVGFGFELQRTEARVRGIYTRRNFLGGLRTLRLSLEPAYVAIPAFWNVQRQGPAGRAEIQLSQPDLLVPLDQLKLTGGYDVGIDYAYQFHGPRGQVAYGRGFFRDRLQLSISYNFQYLLFFNTDPTILADPQAAHRLFGYTDPYRLGWWEEDVIVDLRDRPLDAHSGGYLGLAVEEGGVFAGGVFQYEKITPEARGYIPVGKRVGIVGRLQFGQLFAQGDLGSPITRRFFLGGPDSHRGFSYNRLSPQVASLVAGAPRLPIGGDQMVLAQAEIRIAMARLFGFWLEGAFFVDAGDVAAPACPSEPALHEACLAAAGGGSGRIDLRKLHYAVGTGLRYRTVIGTIRADIGVRLNRTTDAEADGTPNPDPGSRVAFHLSIGEPF